MSEIKHSKTPWHIGHAYVDEHKKDFLCIGPDGVKNGESFEAVCLITSIERHKPVDDANAAHIVHCVNSYDSHTALIKEMKEALEAAKIQLSFLNQEEAISYQKVLSALSSVKKLDL
jgi:hypothetical protein